MIRGRSVSHLDGSFQKTQPTHDSVSHRAGGKWYVTKRGPRYINVYEILEFDAEGLAWLEANEQALTTESKT